MNKYRREVTTEIIVGLFMFIVLIALGIFTIVLSHENLLKKSLGEEIITSFFGASVVPSQSLCFWEENPMNNCGMCDDQDGIKNGQKTLIAPNLNPIITVWEAIGDLPSIDAGESSMQYVNEPSNEFQKYLRNGGVVLREHQAQISLI